MQADQISEEEESINKLQEIFPNYDKKFLLQIYITQNKNFSRTMDALLKLSQIEENSNQQKQQKNTSLLDDQFENIEQKNENQEDQKIQKLQKDPQKEQQQDQDEQICRALQQETDLKLAIALQNQYIQKANEEAKNQNQLNQNEENNEGYQQEFSGKDSEIKVVNQKKKSSVFSGFTSKLKNLFQKKKQEKKPKEEQNQIKGSYSLIKNQEDDNDEVIQFQQDNQKTSIINLNE